MFTSQFTNNQGHGLVLFVEVVKILRVRFAHARCAPPPSNLDPPREKKKERERERERETPPSHATCHQVVSVLDLLYVRHV